MERQAKRPPKRKDHRIILQFDYDCFYAQVFENKNPALKAQPVGVRQKNILATCNYNARARGAKKLMLVSEAKKLCPDLVLVDGEDLTPFRDVSKILFNFLRCHSWNNKVERLGFDEVFMDVTDLVDYNMSCLSKNSMSESFFYLSNKDPELGFNCNLTSIAGCVQGAAADHPDLEDLAHLRLMLGSHLAKYLRTKIEEEFGYTSTCGISTNKLLSKLAGSKNKPRNQTTLLTLNDEQAIAFIDPHPLRSIPGLGFKIAHTLDSHVTSERLEADSHTFESDVTARDVRLHPTVSPGSLETLLVGPGAEKGVGAKVWGLLHGVDYTEVKEASDIPSQISIEDTYKGLDSLPQVTEEMHKLSCSLVRRMRVDLLVTDEGADEGDAQKWIARPKTLRLSTRSWPHSGSAMNYNRVSRSGPLPNFIFDSKGDIEQIAERLVTEALLPLLRRLHSEKGHKWNLQLINICVASMAAGAADDKTGVGRDIAVMFKSQDEVLRPWKITSAADDELSGRSDESDVEDGDADMSWEDTESPACPACGVSIPSFAMPAHMRYHELGD